MLTDKKKIQTIHALLAQIGMANDKEYKRCLVQQYSNGREESSTRLTMAEAVALISDLQALVNKNKSPLQRQVEAKRRLILYYAHCMMWETFDAARDDRAKVDMGRVNGWCVTYGQFHKPLNEHSVSELSLLIVQFERVYQSFLKAV